MHCRLCKREIELDDYDMVTQSQLMDDLKSNNAVHPECKLGKLPPTVRDDHEDY